MGAALVDKARDAGRAAVRSAGKKARSAASKARDAGEAATKGGTSTSKSKPRAKTKKAAKKK